ncbi:MAG: type IX secretion system outer membrane channel protein PorV [Chlorobi bacterium]|nr:type IX secretion system outer membrane channel protein PorV [Chlorobiota bacterium]
MVKKLFFITAFSIFVTGNLFSQNTTILGQQLNAITTGVPFLTIAPDARSGAMGDAGVASSPDANSVHWNPAKYAFIDQDVSLNLSYIPWLRNLVKDINFQNLSGSYKLGKNQVVAASLMYFSLGNIEFTDIAGTKIRDFKPNEFSLDFAYALKLSKYLSGGIAFRYIHSNLTGGIPAGGSGTPTKPGNAVAGDISMFYTKDVKLEDKNGKFNFGLNISNLGNKISYSDDNYYANFLPANLRIGAAYTLELDEYNSITAMLDINKLLVPTPALYGPDTTADGELVQHGLGDNVSVPVGIFQSFYDAPGGFREEMHELMYSAGMEYWYMKQFAVRAGYFNEHATKGNRKYFTLGIGVKLNVLNFDFAYIVPTAGRQNPLANTLRFTLGFNMANFNKGVKEK